MEQAHGLALEGETVGEVVLVTQISLSVDLSFHADAHPVAFALVRVDQLVGEGGCGLLQSWKLLLALIGNDVQT